MATKLRDELEALPLEEINERYFGEWVLLRVTEVDTEGHITHGKVLVHSKTGAGLARASKKAHREDPNCHLSLFIGGTRRITGDELREAMEKASKEEYVNARW